MLIFLIVACFCLVLYSSILMIFGNSPRERIRTRIDKLSEGVELEYVHSTVLKEKRKLRKLKRKKTLVSSQLENTLSLSGLKVSAQEFLVIWGLLTIGPGVVGGILGVPTLAAVGLCVIGMAVPPFMLQRSKAKQQQLFNKQLGESLTIMSNCMRSGYSFQQAMGSIAKEMAPPISIEFSRVVREINYGASQEQALRNMVARVDNKDLELLVSAIITSTQVGSNLSEILDTISETVTSRIRLREEVRVFSAQGRMSGMIIGVLPILVVLALMILNPSYFMDFANTTIGKGLIVLSVVLEGIGFFMINKIVDIKY